MAICIPDVAAESLDHNSEALLMKAFQNRLGDDYCVFHSFPWLYPGREDFDSAAREGEADFVLLHRAKGLLIIEAKGGEVVLKNRKWCRVVGGGRFKEIRDPAKQVRRASRALKARIELICGEDVARQMRFATAVAFRDSYDHDDDYDGLAFASDAFVVIATHDHAADQRIAERVIGRDFAFCAMVGSMRKAMLTRERLKNKGVADDVIARLRCPAGLDIGAETPEEIAVSIVAEMVRVRRRGASARSATALARSA